MVTIRELREYDKDASIDLLNRVLSFGLADYRYVSDVNSIYFIAEEGHKLIGFIEGVLIPVHELHFYGYKEDAEVWVRSNIGDSEEVLVIHLLAVDPEARNKGVADKLVNTLLEEIGPCYVTTLAWVSDKDLSRLKARFDKYLHLSEYWLDEELQCGICCGICRCDVLVTVRDYTERSCRREWEKSLVY